MGKWEVTEQAINAMNSLSTQLQKLATKINQEVQQLKASYENNKDGLGAHSADIQTLLDEVEITEQDASIPIKKLAIKLNKAALIRQKHIENNKYDNVTLSDNQIYVSQVKDRLNKGMAQTIDREMVLAGAEKRKLREPTINENENNSLGTWEKTTLVLNDDYIPSNCNAENKTFSQIKRELFEEYGIDVQKISFTNGVADFSNISLGNVSTKEIVMTAKGLTSEQYNALEPNEKVAIFHEVFSKSKRNSNFDIADNIASQQQIPIPGLPKGYTKEQLSKWRKKNKFSWDEQVDGGYNLVPTVIHGNVPHTGLVGTSNTAKQYAEKRQKELKDSPEKYSWNEEDAPISITEFLNNK